LYDRFDPKIDTVFERDFSSLSDFSKHTDPGLIFAGTAVYKKEIVFLPSKRTSGSYLNGRIE
jgi:hypothetical protein